MSRPSTYADADQPARRPRAAAAGRPVSTFATTEAAASQTLTRPDVAWAAHLAAPKTGYRLDSAEDLTVVVEGPVVLDGPTRVSLEPVRGRPGALKLSPARWHGEVGHRRICAVSFIEVRPPQGRGRYRVVVDVDGVRLTAGEIAVV